MRERRSIPSHPALHESQSTPLGGAREEQTLLEDTLRPWEDLHSDVQAPATLWVKRAPHTFSRAVLQYAEYSEYSPSTVHSSTLRTYTAYVRSTAVYVCTRSTEDLKCFFNRSANGGGRWMLRNKTDASERLSTLIPTVQYLYI